VSDLDFCADGITRKLVSFDGCAVVLSPFVLGDQVRCKLRTFERSDGGAFRERDLHAFSGTVSLLSHPKRTVAPHPATRRRSHRSATAP
jgi:hypothetical protein